MKIAVSFTDEFKLSMADDSVNLITLRKAIRRRLGPPVEPPESFGENDDGYVARCQQWVIENTIHHCSGKRGEERIADIVDVLHVYNESKLRQDGNLHGRYERVSFPPNFDLPVILVGGCLRGDAVVDDYNGEKASAAIAIIEGWDILTAFWVKEASGVAK